MLIDHQAQFHANWLLCCREILSRTKEHKTRQLKTIRSHLVPRSSICIMDLPAPRTIRFLHENGLARLILFCSFLEAHALHNTAVQSAVSDFKGNNRVARISGAWGQTPGEATFILLSPYPSHTHTHHLFA